MDVRQVHRRRDARAECPDGAVDELVRHLVVCLQRFVPDTAGEARLTLLLHDLEEVGLLALLVPLASLKFHGGTTGVSLHTTVAAAATQCAVLCHDLHVADFAGGPAADPEFVVDDDSTADACSTEHPDE